jgi:hypothetical protein
MSAELEIKISESGETAAQQQAATQPVRQQISQADFDALVKQMGAAAVAKAGIAPLPQQQAATQATVQDEAKRRLERVQREKAVEQEMRAQDADYKARAELRDAYQENAKVIRELTEAARLERIALEQMTTEQRIEHLAQKAASKQMEADAVKERTRQLTAVPMAERVQTATLAEPEAVALHDEAAYQRQINEAKANRERKKRLDELRREQDPDFDKSEREKEMRQHAMTVAMGGAAIGGKIGRAMGIASQVMASP